jgi:hypothetical protein
MSMPFCHRVSYAIEFIRWHNLFPSEQLKLSYTHAHSADALYPNSPHYRRKKHP